MAQQSLAMHKDKVSKWRWRAWLWPFGLVALSIGYASLVLLLNAHPVVVLAAVVPFALVLLLAKPRYTLYLLIGFSLVSDTKLLPWMPFHNGLSETLGQKAQWLIVSPLEIFLIIALVSQIVRLKADGVRFQTGTYFWPMAIFYLFVVFGLVSGLVQGGSMNAALWEVRSLIYIPAVYLAFINTVHTEKQLRVVWWLVLGVVGIDCVLGTWNYQFVLHGDMSDLRAGTDHILAIFVNLLFLVIVAYILFGHFNRQWWFAVLVSPLAMITLAMANRRAGWLGLAIACVLLFVLALRENKVRTLKIGLVLALIGIVYAGAFWNSSSMLAKPLQSFKSADAVEGSTDYYSNLYRENEKWDIVYTIRSHPVFGVGFGGKFSMPIELMYYDYPLREYITHNSMVWIWLKTGVFGFVAFLFFLGVALMKSTRLLCQIPDPESKVPLMCGMMFIVMFFVYCYLDQAWDAKGTVFLGTVFGMLAVAQRLLGSRDLALTTNAKLESGGDAIPG